MEEGFVGFNPGQVKSDIQNFATQAGNACMDLEEAFCGLFIELHKAWASPRAVDFNQYIPELEKIIEYFSDQIKAVIRGAVNAYNYAASAHGVGGFIDVEEFEVHTINRWGYEKLEESRDGNVGMNVQLVKDFILENFRKEATDVLNRIRELPTSIALYDNEDGQRKAYSTNIKQTVEVIAILCRKMDVRINIAIVTEANNIMLAKQNATDTLTAAA